MRNTLAISVLVFCAFNAISAFGGLVRHDCSDQKAEIKTVLITHQITNLLNQESKVTAQMAAQNQNASQSQAVATLAQAILKEINTTKPIDTVKLDITKEHFDFKKYVKELLSII